MTKQKWLSNRKSIVAASFSDNYSAAILGGNWHGLKMVVGNSMAI
jgi:hypothetical protein